MSVRSSTAAAGLSVLLLASSASDAQACSCATPDEGTVRRADAAVIATLVEITPLGESSKADFAYRVDRVFKGKRRIDDGEVISVRSWRGEDGCGMPEDMDKRYGLFLDRDAQRWTSNLCLTVSPGEIRKLTSDRGSASSTQGACD
jgi:hypothetical protein